MVRRTINWPFQHKKHRVLKDFPCTSSITDANYKLAKKRRPNPKLKMGNYLKFTQNLTNKRRPRDVANWLSQYHKNWEAMEVRIPRSMTLSKLVRSNQSTFEYNGTLQTHAHTYILLYQSQSRITCRENITRVHLEMLERSGWRRVATRRQQVRSVTDIENPRQWSPKPAPNAILHWLDGRLLISFAER